MASQGRNTLLAAGLPAYISNPKHRNSSSADAQWTILEEEEHTSFVESWTNGWCLEGKGWGLHLVDGSVATLGRTEAPVEDSFIARFVSSDEPIRWHGYPANRRKNQDIPPREIRYAWLSKGLLAAAKISKIGKGKRCRL